MQDESRRFQSSFLRIAPLTVVVTLVLLFLMELLRSHGEPNWERFAFIAGCSIVIALGLIFVVILFCPVVLRPEGLKTYNFWGAYSEVNWAEITSTSTANILGFRYITFQPTGKPKLYVPLFLADMVGFRDQVAAWAGEQHPLTLALFSS